MNQRPLVLLLFVLVVLGFGGFAAMSVWAGFDSGMAVPQWASRAGYAAVAVGQAALAILIGLYVVSRMNRAADGDA